MITKQTVLVPDIKTAGKTKRQIAISCIAEKLGISEDAVADDLELGHKAHEITLVVSTVTREVIVGFRDMTAGDLFKQL